ncbi:NAD(P)-dependent oxidoreductase, partial [Brachionus plicatilis]
FRTEEKAKPFRISFPNIEIVVGCDADNPDTLNKAFQGAQYALIVTPHDPKRGIDDDARLTKNMIESAVANNVEYIVLVASWTVHFPEQLSLLSSRFKPSEILLEKYGKEKGLKWTILRGGVFMENTISNVTQAVKTSVYNFPDILCPYIDTKDIGRCAAVCLVATDKNEHHEKFYEMNGPEKLNGERLAEICSKVFEKKITFQSIAKEEFKKFMPDAVSQVFEFMVENRNCVPFTNDVKNLTGEWSSYEDFIRNHLNDFFN